MSTQSHLDSDLLLEKLSHLVQAFPIKIIFTSIISYFTYCFDGKYTILGSLFALIVFDTFTGVWCAVKAKEVSSRGFYRTTVKCLVYFIMLIVARIVDKSVLIPFASTIMDSFLVVTEAISILENISKLGFMVPQVIISKLKVLQKPEKKDDIQNN